jgi:regulator of replication initiation timing|tara:strand:+ start:1824 stop:2078 length:255 start_codon:yes stop_codon:yes gene_type:complete
MTIQEINFHTNYELLAKLLLEFNKSKPKETDKYMKALSEMYFYINSMHIENRQLRLNNSNIKQEIRKQTLEFYKFKKNIEQIIE